MKQRLMQFMYGRNGVDLFSRFLTYAALVMILLNIIVRGAVGRVFMYLALALLVYSYFRMFSRNLSKRRAENAKYCEVRARFVNAFRDGRERFRQRKDFCFFRCRTGLRESGAALGAKCIFLLRYALADGTFF